MGKLKSFLKNKKKLLLIIGAVVAAIVVVVGIILLVKAFSKPTLEQKLETIGRDFYEKWYYNLSGKDDNERKEKLAKFSSVGLKISLDNLSRIKTYTQDELTEEEKAQKDKEHEELFASFVEKTTNNPCDKDKTMVTIYPTSPYGKKDYKIEIKLVCEPKPNVEEVPKVSEETPAEEEKEDKKDDEKEKENNNKK